MQKFLLALFFSLIILLAVLWIFKARVVSHFLTNATGMDIQMEELHLSFDGLTAKNVKVYEPNAATTLTLGSLSVDTNMWHIFKDVVTIEKIQIDNVNLDSKLGDIKVETVDKIFNFAKKLINKKKDSNASSPKQKKYVIKSLEATNVHVSIDNPIQKGQLVKMNVPQIKINNLDQGKGVTLQEAIDFFVKKSFSATQN